MVSWMRILSSQPMICLLSSLFCKYSALEDAHNTRESCFLMFISENRLLISISAVVCIFFNLHKVSDIFSLEQKYKQKERFKQLSLKLQIKNKKLNIRPSKSFRFWKSCWTDRIFRKRKKTSLCSNTKDCHTSDFNRISLHLWGQQHYDQFCIVN